MDLHDLTAGYALDALDPDERTQYEEHLASCEPCRDELQGFWQVSGALARAAGGPTPPAALRGRILAQARAERPKVVPLRPRLRQPVTYALATAAALALGLGLWSATLARELDSVRNENQVLGDPNARTYESAGGEANLVVTPTGEAALVVRKLAPAPMGKDYVIWVLDQGVMRRAGQFNRPGVTVLSRPVAPGQSIAVTLEQDGGVDAPTGDPLFTASSV